MRTATLILAIQTALPLILQGEDGLFVVDATSTYSDGRRFGAQVLQVTPTIRLAATLLTPDDGGVDALFVDTDSRWILATSYYAPVVLAALRMDRLDLVNRVALAENPWLVSMTHLVNPPGKPPRVFFGRFTDVGRDPDQTRRTFGAVSLSDRIQLSDLDRRALEDLKYLKLAGTAGLAGLTRPDIHAMFPIDRNGKGSVGSLFSGAMLPIEFPVETRTAAHNHDGVIHFRNGQETVVTVYEHDGIQFHRWTDFAWVFSEQSKSWKKVGIGNDEAPEIRGFGPWFVVMGKAVPNDTFEAQKALRKSAEKHRGTAWATGPDLQDVFGGAHLSEYTGELRIFNANSAAEWRLKTDNENSEVLLIEGETMIYRVGREIWSALLTADGNVSAQKKLATDSRLEDAHWAFYSPINPASPKPVEVR